MNSIESVELLKSGTEKWNSWRKANPNERVAFREIDFVSFFSEGDFYDLPEFSDVDFSDVDFHMSSLRNCTFTNCCFDGSKMTFADFVDAYFESCTFRNVSMRVTAIGDATFNNCIFEGSDLSYCSAQNTSFKGSRFKHTLLEHMSLVDNDFSDTLIEGCHVYGISSWDMNLTNSIQRDIVITPDGQAVVTVDNIELAQFLYLIINNSKLRNVLDTITSKVVLILGNFSPERKAVLDRIRECLRTYNLIPVMFDFQKPSKRNLTETMATVAAMSKFIIVDLSDPRSVPHELANIVPRMPSVNFYPLITEGQNEYGMFADYSCYGWVKEKLEYTTENLEQIVEKIVFDNTSEERSD